MADENASSRNEASKSVEIGSQQARLGVISGRVVTVLIISLLLAFVAMAALLSYFWS